VPTPAGPQKVFIAELQSWPGNSGSPVFLNLNGLRHNGLFLGSDLRFLGIMLGDFVNKIPATMGGQQVQLGAENAENVGVSFILPATSLRSILDSKDAKAHRERVFQDSLKKTN
jgi:hypothetical protein